MMDGMLSTYLEQVKDRVNSCEEFYELQQQQWQESIRLRTEEGIVKTIAGVGTMILGGILIVATCGMALPLVTTVGVAAIGLGTAAYGCANAVEGGQDVYAGVTGDPRMVSVNPIRDTLFASNPDLYYLIGNTLTISASLLLTGEMAANAAISAGTSIGRAVVTGYAKQGLTMAASSYVEKSMTEATNSPLAGFLTGSLIGIATYGMLSELDSMANVSGLHSSFAEGMSKEDAQKYLDFLENGSKEGLTEAEIRGIGKVDEALALKKVNPEELLELRKQQLGNVGETSYGKSTLNSLKNTENFTDSAIEHIFEGQVNARGKAVGYHYEGIEGTSGNVIPGTESSTNNFGIYKAKVEVNGIPKTANGGFSTFYSKNLSPQQVVDAINEAYSNCELKLGTRNTYQGVANNGMKIDMFLDQSGKIISAFPEE